MAKFPYGKKAKPRSAKASNSPSQDALPSKPQVSGSFAKKTPTLISTTAGTAKSAPAALAKPVPAASKTAPRALPSSSKTTRASITVKAGQGASKTKANFPAIPVSRVPRAPTPPQPTKPATKSTILPPKSTAASGAPLKSPAVSPKNTAATPAPLSAKTPALLEKVGPTVAKTPLVAPPVKAPTKIDPLPGRASKAPSSATSRLKTKTPPATSAPSDGSKKRILFVTSECSPLVQTGGLGDAVAGLSKALTHRGHDVRIVMPLYRFIDRARYDISFSHSCCVHFGEGEEIWIGIFEGKLDGVVPIWFIDYARYFDRSSVYGDPDDAYRFGVLSKAALQVCKDMNFIPHLIHVHDWMSSMVSVFLKTWDRVLSPLSQTASVLTIHNIGYQGKFDPSVLRFYGLGGDYMRPDRMEDFGAINLLKAGIQYADAITTVSPTYAREIREPIGGMGLAPYLNDRAGRLFGILNGVDTTVWNPETDKYLPARYSRKNLKGKAACKRALQERFGLTVDPKIPLFGTVSRFAPQKGFDLMRGALPQSMRDMVMQVVALGSGDPVTENFFRWLGSAFPGRANAHIGFSPELAHLIEAGCDFFLMPSLYEPCGLNQMYSSLYGALPIVRATGGLDDTVENYNEEAGTGTGFKFWDISDRALYFTIGWAVSTWFDRPRHYLNMQQQGMARDVSWESSAREYEKVYEHAMAYRAAL